MSGKNDANEGDNHTSKPKNVFDVSNKFWSHIEPYCGDITPEDISTLENSLTVKSEIGNFYEIPPLGKHYSEIWAKEDYIEETQQTGKLDKKRNNGPASPKRTNTTFEKGEASGVEVEEVCPYGSFTQQLVAALVDENIMAPMTGNEMQDVKIPQPFSKVPSKKNICYKTLESAIKEQLFSLGLIDSPQQEDDDVEFDASDEILTELQKCQSELKALIGHNYKMVSKVTEHAKRAMKKQEIKQKAKEVDAELVDTFRRFSSSKAKKKGVSRKDRELAWKALRDREAIWKLVDASESET